MTPGPWLTIVMLGVAVTGYAWMMPKAKSREKETEFVTEAAYDQLLEDLESENRELLDAVAKFKQEQDETVHKLGRRIVDLEQQMRSWLAQSSAPATPSPSQTSNLTHPSSHELVAVATVIEPHLTTQAPDTTTVNEQVTETELIAPTTIRGRYAELLDMHEKGRSIEQIAKALGLNKGEVMLIVQLARREEQQHA
jgi:DNA-directed RNA polymerase specialized sigma24 family protein